MTKTPMYVPFLGVVLTANLDLFYPLAASKEDVLVTGADRTIVPRQQSAHKDAQQPNCPQ